MLSLPAFPELLSCPNALLQELCAAGAALHLPLLHPWRRRERHASEAALRLGHRPHCAAAGPWSAAVPSPIPPGSHLHCHWHLEAGMLQGVSDHALDGYLNAIRNSVPEEWS